MSSYRLQRSSYPAPHIITRNEIVWLLDNTAYRSANDEWEAEFVVAVFSQDSAHRVANINAELIYLSGYDLGDEIQAMSLERYSPFLRPILPGKVVDIRFVDEERFLLRSSLTGPHGLSVDIQNVPHFEDGDCVISIAKVPPKTHGMIRMKTFYAEPEGWGVISDVEDTIKVTHTTEYMDYIEQTFTRDPRPVRGMPELYQYIQDLIGPSLPFFYLSTSPYILYIYLSHFCQKFFPHGTIILRNISCPDFQSLLNSLKFGPNSLRIDQIIKIHSWLPKRKMICIGDSTHNDPEVYAEMYRMFPGWIRLILIRIATGIEFSGGGKPCNHIQRFERAFRGVQANHWFLFDSPEQCQHIIRQAVTSADLLAGQSLFKQDTTVDDKIKFENIKSEDSKTEVDRNQNIKTEEDRSQNTKIEEDMSGNIKVEEDMTGNIKVEEDMTGNIKVEEDMSGNIKVEEDRGQNIKIEDIEDIEAKDLTSEDVKREEN